MENISSTVELQDAIQLLEAEQAFKLILMKQNFRQAYETLKPINIIGNILDEVTTSSFLTNNIIDTTIGLTVTFREKQS